MTAYDEWYAETYPDGMGEGFGGWYSEREIREAWEAGHEAGHDDATGYYAKGGSFK